MRRKLQVIFLFLLLPLFNLAQSTTAKQTIYAPATVPLEALHDFKYLLEKSTGENWQIQLCGKNTSHGISLKLDNDNAFKTKESFRFQGNGVDLLTITSSSPEGLVFGFYKHLRQLGFQFYLPGEDYTIIPKLTNPFGTRKDIVDKPFLQIRNFFGTGGFGTSNADPDQTVEKAWNLWKLRNGFGSAYALGGHRGENFVLENKETLQKNPQWLSTPLKGQPSDVGIKLNYLNKEALDYYTDWTIKPFTQGNFAPPPPNHTELISIEPSDGAGFLNEYQPNKSLPSVSDQVYGAANVAAQKLDKLFPDRPNIGVNLYAYSSHAAPPSFPLNPRVFVQLIPYQFQNIAFGPSFIKLWASKAKRFGIYDYYNYADAQFDLPGGMTIEEAMKRLVHSVRAGSEGTTYETSYSKFATGIPLWLLGRYMADGNADWQKNLEGLTRVLYGEAAPKILELFQLFYNQPSFGIQYMGNALKLLNEAVALATDNEVHKRSNELKEYLQFAHLVYQSRDVKNGTTYQRLLPVAEYAWKLYPQKIVHSYRIMQLVSYAFLNIDKNDKDYALYQKLHIDWFPETDRTKAAWAKIRQGIDLTQVNSDFHSLIGKYKVADLPGSYDFEKVEESISQSFLPGKTMVFGGGSLVRGYFGVYSDKATTLTLHYKIDGPKPFLTLSSIDKNYLHDTAIVATKMAGTIAIKLSAGETTIFLNAGDECSYRIQVAITNGLFFFDGSPRGKLAFYKAFSDPYEQYTYQPAFYPSHIFVPKGISSMDYKVQLNALTITSPIGRKIKSDLLLSEHGGFETRKFAIQSNETGKIWKAEVSGNYNYNFLNIPDRYLLLQEK
jgi:hypothetical protein